MNKIQTFGYRDIELTTREMKALYKALDRKLCDFYSPKAHLISLNKETLTARLRENESSVIRISTGAYWGFWKCVTRNEIVWELSRYEAIKLRALLAREIERGRKSPLTVTRRMLSIIPLW